MTETVSFRITDDLIRWFARITGDQSSLHTDSLFGRKSMYRENVAHGMLPLAFLARLPAFESGARIRNISANFLKPVFSGDSLELRTNVAGGNREEGMEIEYEIVSPAGSPVTTGSVALDFPLPKPRPAAAAPGPDPAGIILDRLAEREWSMETVKRGEAGGFRFTLTPEHLLSFENAVGAGGNPDAAAHLLTAFLCSTFVGMVIPGRHATFLNFALGFPQNIRTGVPYRFTGTVAFVSTSTQTIAETVEITSEQMTGPVASGKIGAKVNPPPIQMPSIRTLKADLDLGLKDKVVLVTGASGGIGETTAKLFALHGAKVAVHYNRSKEEADRIVAEIASEGGTAAAVAADVSDAAQVRDMAGRIRELFGDVEILVNNAAKANQPSPFMELAWDDVQREIDTNLKGAFLCCQAVIPAMVAKGEGKIISISTTFTDDPPANQAKYVISKSGLTGLTRSLAVEMAPHNIQVNMVCPSIVETNFSKHVSKLFLDGMKNDTPMKRHASPADVAKTVVSLASSLFPFTTGQRIMVTGGKKPFL